MALKVLPFAAMLSEQRLTRFQNEARAAATLSHPNIVTVFAVGVDRGVHYYAMELIRGPSLAEVIQEEIGIPSLFIESDMADPRAYAEAPTRVKMEAFLEMLEEKKR